MHNEAPQASALLPKERGGGSLQSPAYTPQALSCIQTVAEEEEEGSIEGDAQSDKGDKGKDTPNTLPPNSPQVIIQTMLDNLCCGVVPDDLTLPTTTDSALDLIRDWAMLVTAQSQLSAALKEMTTDLVLHGHVMAMLGLFNIFLNDQLACTWKQASMIIAASEGWGISCTRKLQACVLTYLRTRQLLCYAYSGSRSSTLDDEDVAQLIQLEVLDMTKGGGIKATNVVDIVLVRRDQCSK